MKKLVLILFVVPAITFSQIAYYDAIELSKLNPQVFGGKLVFPISNNDNVAASKILQKYFGGANYGEVQANMSSNPFMNLPTVASLSSSSISSATVEKLAGGIGGLNITNIADGFAQFLVDRTKQELSITFFQNFKETLEKNEDFGVLFPKTFTTLKAIDKDVYQFSHYLNTLREAFKKDLQDVLTTLETFLEAKKTNRYAANSNDIIAQKIEYFESALLIINNIRQGVHPAAAIEKIEFQNYHQNNIALQQIQEGVKVFSMFSNSLRATDSERYWVDSNSLKKLLNPAAFKIYLGLLYQLHGEEVIFNKKFKTCLDEVANGVVQIEVYKSYVKQLILDSEKITLAIQNVKQKKERGEKVESYKELFASTLSFLKNFKDADQLNFQINLANTDEVWTILGTLNDLYLDVHERKYNSLILDLSEILTEVLGADNFAWKENLIKYGTFIANVAEAENSKEVQSAIEAVALPVGSASIKKRTKQNVSLNAYVGLSPGWEHNGELGKRKVSFGVNAPIGIAWSRGHYKLDKNKKYEEGGSSTLFLSLIDIGAVTTFRFADSETEQLPEIKLENIFAPGLYYVYGLPKAPISLGFGGQLGPQLRSITSTTANLNSGLSYSFKFFIAVDIPLLNFYSKARGVGK